MVLGGVDQWLHTGFALRANPHIPSAQDLPSIFLSADACSSSTI